MPPTNKVQTNRSREPSQQLTDVLRQYLNKSEEGREVVRLLEQEPTRGRAALAEFLEQRLNADKKLSAQVRSALDQPSDRPISTIVTGGKVEQIINIANLDELKTTKRYYLFQDRGQVALFLSILIAVGSLIGAVTWWFQQPEKMPDGGFNIAIAQIGEVTAKGVQATERTTKFAFALSQYLSNQTGQDDFGLDVYVSNKNMPIIQQEGDAINLARRINADLVVYGTVTYNREIGKFLPNFYVAGRSGGMDASGYNQFARPITFTTAYDSEEELEFILHTRAVILTNFVKGLVYFNIQQPKYKAAENSFQIAVNEAEKLPPFGGQEVLYLMLAAAQRQQATPQKFEQALDNLGKALDRNPQYARAGIGMGNSYFDEYKHSLDVSGEADSVLLEQAEAEYLWALNDATDKPLSAHIDAKANIGIGNILILRAQQQRDFTVLEEAVKHYQLAIEEYRQNPEAKELARIVAYAYHNLGSVYGVQGKFDAAKDAYENCVNLPTDEKEKYECQKELNQIRLN